MAKSYPIAPFPESLDRERFAEWLSGLADGEGCFLVRLDVKKKYAEIRFNIGLRSDDEEILRLIQSFFGCGRIVKNGGNRPSPLTSYLVSKFSDLYDVVIPHFIKHPLRTRKAKDFIVWLKAATLVSRIRARPYSRYVTDGRFGGKRVRIRKWSPEELEEFLSYVHELKTVRKYRLD